MCKIRELVAHIREETGLFPVLIFGSAMHGAGRSFVSKKVAKAVSDHGFPVERIGVGEIFRKIAAGRGISIDQLAEMQCKNPDLFYKINTEIDEKIYEKMHSVPEYAVGIIDSNLAAYYADGDNTYAFLVYTPPEIVAERVLRARRSGDSVYKNREAALKALIERTREDIQTYRELADMVGENFWKLVYKTAADDMDANLRAVLGGDTPDSPFYNASIDNSGTGDRTMSEWCRTLDKILTHRV